MHVIMKSNMKAQRIDLNRTRLWLVQVMLRDVTEWHWNNYCDDRSQNKNRFRGVCAKLGPSPSLESLEKLMRSALKGVFVEWLNQSWWIPSADVVLVAALPTTISLSSKLFPNIFGGTQRRKRLNFRRWEHITGSLDDSARNVAVVLCQRSLLVGRQYVFSSQRQLLR